MKKNSIIAILCIALMLSLGFGFIQKAEADAQRKIAEKNVAEAIAAKEEAQRFLIIAEDQSLSMQKDLQTAYEELKKLTPKK